MTGVGNVAYGQQTSWWGSVETTLWEKNSSLTNIFKHLPMTSCSILTVLLSAGNGRLDAWLHCTLKLRWGWDIIWSILPSGTLI